ncbi:3'(2'),5'-bisphosphate nucleotidase CysQ [Beggiatoa leptomitoformis]
MMSDDSDPDPTILLEAVNTIAKTAGEHIMTVYEKTDFNVVQKADKSPLTEADMAAHNVIVKGLQQLTPDIPVLSEESARIPFQEREKWQTYWLVDPLDGTREFIKRNGEFTVNIALIHKHHPMLGVVYVPVTKVLYYAIHQLGAYKQQDGQPPQRIFARRRADRLTVAGSRSHGDEHFQRFVKMLGEVDVLSIGSSLKSCLIAEGKVDVYPRFGPTSEWDTAAAQCIVEQAGGYLTDVYLQPLRYNTKESLLNPNFLVFGDASQAWSHYLAQAV